MKYCEAQGSIFAHNSNISCKYIMIVMGVFQAIKAARTDNGFDQDVYYRLNPPATCERIRMACLDQFTKQVVDDHENFQPKISN